MFYERTEWSLKGRYEFDLGDTQVSGCHFEETVKAWANSEPAFITEDSDGYKVFKVVHKDGKVTVCTGCLSIRPVDGEKFADGLYSVSNDSLWVSNDPEAGTRSRYWRIAVMQNGDIRVRELQKSDLILMDQGLL